MWVQEGSDYKDTEDDSRTTSSIFSRGMYSYSYSKPKTTVSTRGIRMVPPTPTTSPEKDSIFGVNMLPTADEKEEETDQEDTASLIHLRSRPITPAKFLENMSTTKKEELKDGGVPLFSLGDPDSKGGDSPILEPEQIEDISKMFELDGNGVDAADHQLSDQMGASSTTSDSGDAQSTSFDLCVIGTKLPIPSAAGYVTEDEEAEDIDAEEPAVGSGSGSGSGSRMTMKPEFEVIGNGPVTVKEDHYGIDKFEITETLKTPKTKKSSKSVKSTKSLTPQWMRKVQKFKGLDVKKWSEWTECIEFSKQKGLVVVEVYSVVFGPSEAMYPFIEDIVERTENKKRVKFVRLSLHTMSSMEVIHEAIVDHKHYYPSPLPTFLFIKNGKKVAQLTGTQPDELGKLIEKQLNAQPRAATAPVSPVSVKYKSILERSPGKKARTSSSMFQTPRKVPVTVEEKGENIMNLLRTSQATGSCGSEYSSPTKLWKNEMLLVD